MRLRGVRLSRKLARLARPYRRTWTGEALRRLANIWARELRA